MARVSALLLLFAVTATGTVQAQDGTCLMFDVVAPTETYLGPVGAYGGSGGVMDGCRYFSSAGSPFLLDRPDGTDGFVPGDIVQWNTVQTDLSLWIGETGDVWFRFMLDGVEQHSTGWMTLSATRNKRYQWTGAFNEVQVWGVQVVMLYKLDEVPLGEEVFLDEGSQDPEWLDAGQFPELRVSVSVDAGVVPEPATLTLLATGVMGLAGAARRRRESRRA